MELYSCSIIRACRYGLWMNINERKEIKMSANRARGVLWKYQHTAVPPQGYWICIGGDRHAQIES